MGSLEPFVAEDLEIIIEDIFGEIHPEGQQISVASPAVKREEVEPEVTMARKSPRTEVKGRSSGRGGSARGISWYSRCDEVFIYS